jgi:WD40 repeat protein
MLSKQYGRDFLQTIATASGGLLSWPALQNSIPPDGKCVVSGASNGMIRVWDAETGELVARPFKGQRTSVDSVAFSADGTRLFRHQVGVWDAETGEVAPGPFKEHSGCITSVAFSPDGRHIISGSGDNTIRV